MDHYTALGLNKNATTEEIKKAYRKLASQNHPDKGGDTAKFQKIQEAYDTLSDPQKRAQYDNPMHNNFMHGQQGFPGGFNFNFNGGGIDINDIFSQFFTHPNMQRPNRQVFRTGIAVSLKEAYTGTNKILDINTQTGKKVIDLKIPPGINTGDQIRYDNVIDNAVLLVEFNVLPDLKFDRRGNDLYCNQSISVLDLIVGTSIDFVTLSGKTLQITIKPQTQPHANIKLNGYGMPVPNTSLYGDQYLLIKPYIPDNISSEIIDSILRNK